MLLQLLLLNELNESSSKSNWCFS